MSLGIGLEIGIGNCDWGLRIKHWNWGYGLGIGVRIGSGDWGLQFGIEIGDWRLGIIWDWRLGFWIEIGEWDLRLGNGNRGLRIGI